MLLMTKHMVIKMYLLVQVSVGNWRNYWNIWCKVQKLMSKKVMGKKMKMTIMPIFLKMNSTITSRIKI